MAQVTQLAADGGSAVHPSFTPDGARVVFVADLGTGDGGAVGWAGHRPT
jgi:Tol biopolymer transport system component